MAPYLLQSRYLGLEYVSTCGDRDFLSSARRVTMHTFSSSNNNSSDSNTPVVLLYLKYRLRPVDVDRVLSIDVEEREDEVGMELLFKQVPDPVNMFVPVLFLDKFALM